MGVICSVLPCRADLEVIPSIVSVHEQNSTVKGGVAHRSAMQRQATKTRCAYLWQATQHIMHRVAGEGGRAGQEQSDSVSDPPGQGRFRKDRALPMAAKPVRGRKGGLEGPVQAVLPPNSLDWLARSTGHTVGWGRG